MTATEEHSVHEPQPSATDSPAQELQPTTLPQANPSPVVSSEHLHSPPNAPSPNDGGNAFVETETPADPKVAALLAMFPDFDTSLLQSVLESVAGDQGKAVDVLLGMNDPSYTSTERPDATQTELDEEIARRLMLEESEQQASWRPRYDGQQHSPAGGQQQQRQRPVEGDSVAQFQEQLGKFAETGKKTFNTFLSKVKAKMQEFDNPSGQGQPSGAARPLPGGDSWSTPARTQSYYQPHPPASAQGYDVGTPVNPPTGQHQASTASQPITVTQPTAFSTTEVSSSPSTALGAPSTGNVDPAKIGLLPKRPVSLGSSPQPSRNLAEDDDVEYVENPFEEAAHR